jgi:hypothetical protein
LPRRPGPRGRVAERLRSVAGPPSGPAPGDRVSGCGAARLPQGPRPGPPAGARSRSSAAAGRMFHRPVPVALGTRADIAGRCSSIEGAGFAGRSLSSRR